MEGQRIANNLRVCSRCHIIKSTADFYRCGGISKKTGVRYLSSLCKPCHQQATHAVSRRRAQEKKDKHKGQQIVLRDEFVGQSMLVVPHQIDQGQVIADDEVFEAYDSDFALPE